MSRVLYRWGRYAATHALRVLAVWLVIIGTVIALLAAQPKAISTNITLQDTPAQKVLDTIARQLPQAGGTQGTLAITATDGGRVDTPERSAAIAASLKDAASTGYVIDRSAAMASQQKALEEQVRAQVQTKFAGELNTTLGQMVESLTSAKRTLGKRVAAMPASQRPKAQQLAGTVDQIIAEASSLQKAAPAQRIEGASGLFAKVTGLKQQLSAMEMGDALQLPDTLKTMTDPKQAYEDAVQQATTTAERNLAGLTRGTDPKGTPLKAGAATVPDVVVSGDGTTAIASLRLTGQLSDLPSGALDQIVAAVDGLLKEAGLAAAASSSLQPLEPPIGGHEAIGLAIAVLVLFLALGSLVLAGLPLLTAGFGALIGVGGAYALSSHFQMTTATPAIGLMLALAVGIDYALFLVHKQRSLATRMGISTIEAIARAVATAGGAVLFAGSTVAIALLGLLTLGIGFVSMMALVAATTVALAVALALTALPALLGLVLGRRAPRTQPVRAASEAPHHSRFGRAAQWWVRVITAQPIITILLVVAALGALAIPAKDMRLGMPSGAVAAAGSASRLNYDAVTRTLGEGASAPLVVAITPAAGTTVDQARLAAWQKALAAEQHVDNVALMGATDDHGLVIYTVTPDAGPTATETSDLVTTLRGTPVDGASSVGVTGLTAMNIDLSDALAAALPTYLMVVVGLSLIVLLIVFRSVLVPLVATAGFLLAIGAALGLAVSAFSTSRYTWLVGVDRAGPILSFLPIMTTGILYSLAMDYQVFLGTSMREEHVHGSDARTAVAEGFHHASRVVVAAAIIMVSVFGGFVLSNDPTISQFGFVLSAGILIDAFVVRMTLMPAVLHLAGESAWWLPKWLRRIVPEVDVEGAKLSAELDAADADVRAVPADS